MTLKEKTIAAIERAAWESMKDRGARASAAIAVFAEWLRKQMYNETLGEGRNRICNALASELEAELLTPEGLVPLKPAEKPEEENMKIHPPCTITVADTGAVRHAPGGPTGHFTLCGFVDTSETVSYYDGRPINCKNCLAVVAEVLSWCDPAARSRSMEEWFAVRDAALAALSALAEKPAETKGGGT